MASQIEKFSTNDLTSLRNEMLQSGLDHWQAAEVLSTFLSGRGYGVNAHHARAAVQRIECAGCSCESMQQEIERVAMVM